MSHDLGVLVADRLGVTYQADGTSRCPCPVVEHGSTDPCSVRWEEGLVRCFACARTWTFAGLLGMEEDEGIEDPAVRLVMSRKLPSNLPVEAMPNNRVRIWSDGREKYQDRWVGPPTMGVAKYLTPSGQTGIFWARRPQPETGAGSVVWLTEGPIDAYAVADVLPDVAVGAVCGRALSEHHLYELRDSVPILLFDADGAGYVGARESSGVLGRLKIPHRVLDLPPSLGSDPGEAWSQDREAFQTWAEDQSARIEPQDKMLLARWRERPESVGLRILPTPWAPLNHMLGGGWKTGLHVLGGEPGSGKTSLAVQAAVSLASEGSRVLYITTEIPVTQVWARAMSVLGGGSGPLWSDIEREPRVVREDTYNQALSLADNLAVRAGWGLQRIERSAPAYDMVVVDYVQRLAGARDEDEEGRERVSAAARSLGNLARDNGLVVFMLSSIPRSAYGGGSGSMGVFKESGDIEFIAQSAAVMSSGQTGRLATLELLKNTRGQTGQVLLSFDKGHGLFHVAGRG